MIRAFSLISQSVARRLKQALLAFLVAVAGITSTSSIEAFQGVAPTVSAISPSVAPLLGGSFTLTVTGQDFDPAAQVLLDGVPIGTTFVDATELTAAVPSLDVAQQSVLQISNPGALLSNSFTLKIVERGDINGNGSVNIGDALVTAISVAGLSAPLPDSVGDINLNATTNIGDALVVALFSGQLTPNLPSPTLTAVSPSPVATGGTVTITGKGFSGAATNHRVVFPIAGGGTTRVTPTAVSVPGAGGERTITVSVPVEAVSGLLQVICLEVAMGSDEFPIEMVGTATPVVLSSVSPFYKVSVGSAVTLSGLGFDPIPANNTVLFTSSTGTVAGAVTSASRTTLTVTVPTPAECGPVVVEVGGQVSNARIVTVLGTSCGVGLADILGGADPGELVVIEGSGFDPSVPGNNIVQFTGAAAPATVAQAGRTQLHVRVPATAVPGGVTLTVGGQTSTALTYTLPDTIAPTVSDANISLNQALFKDGDTVTVTWDNTAGGDDNGDIASVTVDLSAFGGNAAVAATNSGETWTASATVGLSGAVGSNLNASVTATDNAGNATTTADGTNATVDNTAPTVSIGLPSGTDTTSGPVTYTITYSGADSVTLADGDVTLNPTGTATGTVAVTETGNTTRTVTISTISGDGTLGISLAAATASDTAGNLAAAAGPSGTFNVDNTAPTTALTEPADGSIFGGSGVTLAATAADAGGTGVAGVRFLIDGQNLGFDTAPTSVDVTITSATAVGAYQVTIAYDPNILKLEPSGVTGGTGAGFGTLTSFNIDKTAGTVSVNAFQIGNAPTGTFTVANLAFAATVPLSEGTSNLILVVDALADTLGNDLTIPPAQVTLTSGSVTVTRLAVEDNVAPYNTSWDSLSATDGAHVLSVVATDLLGNSTVSASINVTVDNTAPTVSDANISLNQTLFKNGDTVTVTWDNTAGGDDNGDIASVTVDLSAFGGGAAVAATNSSGTWTASVTVNLSGADGSNLNAGVTATDNAGNATTTADTTNATVDSMAPTVSIGLPSASDTTSGPVTYTITYSGADSVTLADGDVTLNPTGTATGTVAVTGTGDTTRTVTISAISGDGTLGISLGTDTASDTAGNQAAAAGPSGTFNVDNTVPTVGMGAPSAADTASGPVTYTITYSGADSVTLADGDVTLNPTGTATGTVAVTGTGNTMRTVTISAISGDWTLGISLAAATASDTLGEQAAAAGPSGTFNVDNTAPTTVLTEPADGSTFRGNGVTLTATATDVGGTGVAGVEFLIDGQNLGFNTAPTSVDVTITSTTAVGAYQVTIGYDPNILKLIPSGVTGGTGAGFTGTPTVVNIDNTAGTVTINAFQTGNSPTGTFTVANLAFIPLSDGTSNLSLVVNVLTDTLSIDLTIPPRRLR